MKLSDWLTGAYFLVLLTCIFTLGGCAKKPKVAPAPVEKVNGIPADDGQGGGTLFDAGMAQEDTFGPVYFALNSDNLNAEARTTIAKTLSGIKGYESCHLEGYACPIGANAYNLALGAARAEAVRNYMSIAGYTGHLSITSYGEELLASETDYPLNRRVLIKCSKYGNN